MDLINTLLQHKEQTNEALDAEQNPQQKRDAMLLALYHMNPKMMDLLGERSKQYIQQLLQKQQGQ